MNLLDPNFLFASLIWGSIGVGYTIYGRRQRSAVAFVGGVLMIAASYFIEGVLTMSLISLGLMVAVYYLIKQGY
jgi:hypothetical protein